MRSQTNHLVRRAIAVLVGAFITLNAVAEVKVGDAFPDLAKFKLEGRLPSDLKGKVVVIDFWASWCAPCKQSFPTLDALLKQYSAKGVVVIAINEDEKKTLMDDFLKANRVTFTVVRDAAPDGEKLVDKVAITGMPSSFIIDREGIVRFSHVGFFGEKTSNEYEDEVASLLKK